MGEPGAATSCACTCACTCMSVCAHKRVASVSTPCCVLRGCSFKHTGACAPAMLRAPAVLCDCVPTTLRTCMHVRVHVCALGRAVRLCACVPVHAHVRKGAHVAVLYVHNTACQRAQACTCTCAHLATLCVGACRTVHAQVCMRVYAAVLRAHTIPCAHALVLCVCATLCVHAAVLCAHTPHRVCMR